MIDRPGRGLSSAHRWLASLSLVVLTLIGFSGAACAGECIDSAETYLVSLEAGPSAPWFDYGMMCLTDIPIEFSHRWAGPVAAKAFEGARQDTLRPRVERVVAALLSSAWADSAENRRVTFQLAARFGIGRVDSVDVHENLVRTPEHFFTWDYVYLAILADPRTRPFLLDRYRLIRAGKGRPAYDGEASDILCCLYHLPGTESVALARELMRTETDAELKERLQRVIDRPS